jgi:hypothetical protein
VNHPDAVDTAKGEDIEAERPRMYLSFKVSDFEMGSGDRLPLFEEERLCLLF